MSVTIPFLWLSIMGLLWASVVIIHARLVALFRRTFPEEAMRDLPAPGMQNPILLTYFLRSSSSELLRRDRNVWKQRQVLVMLLVFSAVFLFIGLLVICIIAYVVYKGML